MMCNTLLFGFGDINSRPVFIDNSEKSKHRLELHTVVCVLLQWIMKNDDKIINDF